MTQEPGMTEVSNLHVRSNTPLPSPQLLAQEIPVSAKQEDFVATARREIADVIAGRDSRFLIIVGPCSIHDVETGMEYARRLVALSKEVAGKVMLVMRVYFEKPRTSVGWKGLIMDPHLNGTNDIPAGLRMARTFMREVIALGVPTATEMLDPITPQYIADLTCWSAIGARTTESQTHRQMASGLSMPVGFKNTTAGGIEAAVNAMKAAVAPQTFLGIAPDGRASMVTTTGNPDCHVILRGGDSGPNCDRGTVENVIGTLRRGGFPETVMIDASHANCGKDHAKMPGVFRSILALRAAGLPGICGAMLESHLHAGSQAFPCPLGELKSGVSITDACIDWETTEVLVREAAGLA
ncbi:MAG TPA: 3-deoxy-7-phosphoheptulonate synthase [Verrucomicrobiales bacterium]|jgi:3-deoxy-7-phosphoheptulonate synthase|nr:3-deoxy-7-phosphoheptulonate synthase [Verrucomicrobiales bacterium]